MIGSYQILYHYLIPAFQKDCQLEGKQTDFQHRLRHMNLGKLVGPVEAWAVKPYKLAVDPLNTVA
jgi:hypothetical protein